MPPCPREEGRKDYKESPPSQTCTAHCSCSHDCQKKMICRTRSHELISNCVSPVNQINETLVLPSRREHTRFTTDKPTVLTGWSNKPCMLILTIVTLETRQCHTGPLQLGCPCRRFKNIRHPRMTACGTCGFASPEPPTHGRGRYLKVRPKLGRKEDTSTKSSLL